MSLTNPAPRLAYVWRCVVRARHETQWFSPARDIAPPVIAGLVTFIATYAVTGGNAAVPTLYGLAALVATVLLVSAGAYARQLMKAPRVLRDEAEALRLTQLQQSSADDMIKQWLRWAMGDASLGVARAAAFGSIVQNRETRDVDVAILMTASSNRNLRKRILRLRALRKPFRDAFAKPLHVQFFASEEAQAFDGFLRDAGRYEEITLSRNEQVGSN